LEQHAEKVKFEITIPSELRVRMIRLRVSPSHVAVRAFEEEVKFREEQAQLHSLQLADPRITLGDLRRRTARVKRLLEEQAPNAL